MTAVCSPKSLSTAQASKIPVAKLAPRLSPLGFRDEHLSALAHVLAAQNEGRQSYDLACECLSNCQGHHELGHQGSTRCVVLHTSDLFDYVPHFRTAAASGSVGSPAGAAPNGDERATVQITTEELDKLAAEMIADSSEESDSDDDNGAGHEDDEAAVVGSDTVGGDAQPSEPDFPDQDHAEAILTIRHKSMAIFVRAAVAHIVRQDLSKSAFATDTEESRPEKIH